MTQQLVVSENVLSSLKATRPWVKFMAIVWFLGSIFCLLFGLAKITGIYTGFPAPGELALISKFMGALYIVMALVYVMPALYLYRYAKAIAGVQGSAVVASFEDALKQQKSFWKYYGIFLIILIVFCVLIIVGSMIFGIYVAAHHH